MEIDAAEAFPGFLTRRMSDDSAARNALTGCRKIRTARAGLLAERMRSAQDVEELSKDWRPEPAETAMALESAQVDIDDQIAKLAGAEAVARIRRIAAVEAQLGQIRDGLAGDLAFEGIPMTSEQTLALAEILRDAYAVASPARRSRPSARRATTEGNRTPMPRMPTV